MEVVEGFLDTHIAMFVTYTSVEDVEDFLDIHIHTFKNLQICGGCGGLFRHTHTHVCYLHICGGCGELFRYTHTPF